MKILFLKHKSTLNYFKEFNDEINLYGQWLTRHNIPYQFDFEEWDEDLQWQRSGTHYTLSPTYVQKLSKKAWWSIGKYHIIIYCYYPEKENSEEYYRTMNSFKCNGGIGILVPLTKKMATLLTQWGWRMLVHETIHALFALLNLTYKKNIPDILDVSVNEFIKRHPDCSEQEALALISGELADLTDNVFDTYIKPHLNLILQPLPEERQVSLLLQMIGLLTTMIKYLKEKLKQTLFLIEPEKEVRNIPVSELSHAMAIFEGWNKPDSLCRRNHNPCNLRWSKYQVCLRNGFAYFANDEMGWKAAEYDICCKQQGYTSTGLNGNSTLRDLIYVWTETDRYAYLMYVATKLKVEFDYKLKNFICSIKL